MPFHYFNSCTEVADSLFGVSSGMLGAFLGFVGTLILGSLALFGNEIRSWLFRPELSPVECKKTLQLIPKNINGAVYHRKYIFYRLIIKNIGNMRARDVRVLLTYEKGDQKELKDFIPVPLNWTHWNKSSRDISRKEPAYVDILRKEDGGLNYEFCWSNETGNPVEPLLMNFYPKFGNIRLEFFEHESKIGDISLKYEEHLDVLTIVAK
jgi:hypothetical protein